MPHQYITGRFSPRRLLNIVLFSFLVYCVFIETEISLFNKGDNDKFVDKFLHPIENSENIENMHETTYTEETIFSTPNSISSNTTTSSAHHHHHHHHENVEDDPYKEEPLPEVPSKPTYIIIVTEWRSGSSFFGDLFNYNPSMFYRAFGN